MAESLVIQPVQGSDGAIPATQFGCQPGSRSQTVSTGQDVQPLGVQSGSFAHGNPDDPLAASLLAPTRQNVRSDYCHPTLGTHHGIIIQIYNANCVSAASMIGGIRVSHTDIVTFPGYLQEQEQTIKAHVVAQLKRHISRNNNAIGFNELVTLEDFSLSFTCSSLTEAARSLHPTNRNEGPLFYCFYPHLLQKMILEVGPHGEVLDSAYFINAYIYLLEQPKRRNVVRLKFKEEEAQKEAVKALQQAAPSSSAAPASSSGSYPRPAKQGRYASQGNQQKDVPSAPTPAPILPITMEQVLAVIQAQNQTFPGLPAPEAKTPPVPLWPTDGMPPIV